MAEMLVEYGKGRDAFLKQAASIMETAVEYADTSSKPIQSLLSLSEKILDAPDGATIELTIDEVVAYRAMQVAAKKMAGMV